MSAQHFTYRGISVATGILLVAFLMTSPTAVADQKSTADLLETHTSNKQRALERIRDIPQLALTQRFGMDFRAIWRGILIDSRSAGTDKETFLRSALERRTGKGDPLHKALAALAESHRRLFNSGQNASLMVRHASDPAFKPFGRLVTPAEALAEMTADNDAEVQAFQTLFETGRNTRGHVHKLECHGQAIEFIYAITDIVYGVMLPSELDFGGDRVTADPARVQMFYVKAGEVIALYPYVLHSGSLSVEPDRSFSILIYKKPAGPDQQTVELPPAWQQRQAWLKIANVDKYYLTLAELHTDDLKDNHGFITDTQPLRLPDWK